MANRWNCDDFIEIADDDFQDTKPSPALLAKSLEDYVQDDDSYYYDENSRRNQLYWTTDATKTLIKLRGDRESEFEQGGARKSQLWIDICRRMRSLGYDFTPEKVSKKWHNILITYNKNLSKKQHSQQVNWEFFDDIDAVFKNRRIEIESTSSYQEDSPPVTVSVSSKRRTAPEISFFEIEKLNSRVSSEPSSTMQLHEVDEEKQDYKKFKFSPEEELSNCNGESDRNWWKDYFEQKLELEKEKLQKEHERHKDNLNFQKMVLVQDKLKVEAINSLTSAIKEYTRLVEAKQTD
ncbi:trihelix transcription factor GT-3b isoform X2 [Bradysia coprophila]|uniref:trihelix transcription factor GT-3b isoform X2 n=1 Tax=Bradysia coprophila TaxID=38358 RepID=UPI00187DD040|nr:trihelix transcription factor GT-3b isoform X2 [Bradysia coprophila]